MRILQLAPPWESVPPSAYGGTEAVVSALTEALVRSGHDVTLWASGDSLTDARSRAVLPRSLRTDPAVTDPGPHEWLHCARAFEDAAVGNYDIIHNHAGELPMAFASLLTTPMLTTTHCAITRDTEAIWNGYRGHFNTISRFQRSTFPATLAGSYEGYVYNGIDVASFPFSAEKGEYVLFLSRISYEKGAHIAIEAARWLDLPLVLAGKVGSGDERYFEQSICGLIDGVNVRFVGEADASTKRELYAGARCLLLPLLWDEPFGLVMTEAMACGTPVVAYSRGAAPELIVNGKTGFLVHTLREMVRAVARVDELNRADCRDHVEKNFDTSQMVNGYVNLYDRIQNRTRVGPRHTPLPLLTDIPRPESLRSTDTQGNSSADHSLVS